MGVHSTFFVPGHLDLWPWHSNLSEQGTKHVFGVNLAQIHSAVPKIFDLRTKKVTDSPKDRTLRSLLHAVKIQLKVFITWLHLTLMKHLSQHIVQITETAKRHQLSTHYNSTLYQHITSKTLTKTYIGTSHNSKHTHTHTEFQIYTHSDQATSLHTFITLTPLTLCKTAAENKPVSNTFRNVRICVDRAVTVTDPKDMHICTVWPQTVNCFHLQLLLNPWMPFSASDSHATMGTI